MTPELREAMGEAAVSAARSINYVGAGTVEFLLDSDGQFYFLEMNTRLQVEHPVSELVTGLDLVDLQLRVAQGGALPCAQDQVTLSGHAIEVRLYAEDTANDFLPASGTALAWEPPRGEGIRVDHGLYPGQEISPFYDPMIAKIIAFGEDRDVARRRLIRALRDTVIFGLETNRQFLIDVLERDSFAQGRATTAFISEEFPDGVRPLLPGDADLCVAALLQYLEGEENSLTERVHDDAMLAGFTGARRIAASFAYAAGESQRVVSVTPLSPSRFNVSLEDSRHQLELIDMPEEGWLRLAIGGIQYSVAFRVLDRGKLALQWRGRAFTLVNELAFSAAERELGGSGAVLAPMHGNLLAVHVAVGDLVNAGDELAVIEAMKMEHRLTAPIAGVVTAVFGVAGEQIAAGALVMEVEAPDSA